MFTGFAAPGGALTVSEGIARLVYKAPRGLDNVLRVDLGVGGWLPMQDLEYDGGGAGSAGAGGRAVLVGATGGWPLASEVHVAAGPGAGSIVFTSAVTAPQKFTYRGLAPDGLLDLVGATDYRFDYQGAADPGVAISAGDVSGATADAQTLRIASPAFVATTIANKANVVIHTNGTTDLATTVDYASHDPVAGLASLTIVTSPNDSVDAAATPPGAVFTVLTPAIPRPAPVPPPAEPTTVVQPVQPPIAPPAADPVVVTPPVATVEEASPAPNAQDVGADFVARFGTALRNSAPPRASVAASPFRSLRAARTAQLQALRARRIEQRHAMVSGARNGRMRDLNQLGTHVNVRTARRGVSNRG
ncbi:MAG: hypothetical protein P4L85_10055 [Paludisphaera borealis]|uniref:hypothetical protein n=1 Tax=Paludisphaera borealis TaxID=1387353 RepID=UPI00284E4477|nr:hypothetical protein [Paludisphaera borealis]MDR3619683.1 hypothetical protein [Paludisphaera borealis]